MCGRRYIFKGDTIRFTESRSSVFAVGRRSKKSLTKLDRKKNKKLNALQKKLQRPIFDAPVNFGKVPLSIHQVL